MRIDDWTHCLEALGRLTSWAVVFARTDGEVLAATAAARARLGEDGTLTLREAWGAARSTCRRLEVATDDGRFELGVLDGPAGDVRATVHDLRGGLNCITLQLDMLRAGLDERGAARVDAVAREVRRMTGLLEGLCGKGAPGAGPTA